MTKTPASLCWPSTPGALDEVEAICALDGLKALMIGPFDLSVALGHQGRLGHPEVAAIRRMVDAAVANDVPSILPIFAPELSQTMHQIEYWRGHGVEVFTIGTDKILLHSQGSRFTKELLRRRREWRMHGVVIAYPHRAPGRTSGYFAPAGLSFGSI